MAYPKIYLAIDNCFAFKRWTRPKDWAKVISDLGVHYIEASADTELDPLFMGESYLKHWVDDVKEAEAKFGVKVANLYSGHGTYCTLGLTHTDDEVRRRMIDQWFKPLIKTAADVGAGLGFFAHAFADFVLQDKILYSQYCDILVSGLVELNTYAEKVGCGDLGVEQMYSPHQVPWRIDETRNLIKHVTKESGRSFYFTEDVGHHHHKFLRPTEAQIKQAFKNCQATGEVADIWLGSLQTFQAFSQAVASNNVLTPSALEKILAMIDDTPHMFSELPDSDCYTWLKALGCYSPIIHLQQTNGHQSAHKHFTEQNNSEGIIAPERVLRALKASFEQQDIKDMPKKPEKVYLTIEAFTSTASYNSETLSDYQKSVNYWREFIPEDGMELDKLIEENY